MPICSALAHWVLRVAFAIRCVGLGAKYLWQTFESDSTIFSTLFFEFGFSENTAQGVDDAGVVAMVVAGAIVLVYGFLNWLFGSLNPTRMAWMARVECLALLFAIGWEVLLAGTAAYRGGELMSQWALAEHGLRIATPLALLALSVGSRIPYASPVSMVEWVLRMGTAATFVVHGAKAWVAAPAFVTMVIATCQNLFGYWPEQASVEVWLKFICAADIVVAVLILCGRWPRVAMYAAVWGLVTALARVTSSNLGWPECLLRSVHVGGPLFLYLQWWRYIGTMSSDTLDDARTKDTKD